MNAEDKQKTEDYEKNRHIVTVKKDMFGNWYFVDANGNRAKTIDGSGKLKDAKHSKKEKMPTLKVSPIETEEPFHGMYVTKTIYIAHHKDFPTGFDTPLRADKYTVDAYEAIYQRQRLLASIEETKSIIFGKMSLNNIKHGSNRLEGLSMFNDFLKVIQPYLAIYFSKKEHPYLREFLYQAILDIVPESIVKSVNIDKLLDNYFDELSQKRDMILNSENEDIKYVGKLAETVSNKSGRNFAFGYTITERVDEAQQENQQDKKM